MYYLAAQLQHFTGWDLGSVSDPSRGLLLGPETDYTALFNMEMGFPKVPSTCPTVRSLMKMWKRAKTTLGLTGYLRQTPIW